MKSMMKFLVCFVSLLTLCFVPMMASAYNVGWSDNGQDNTGTWQPMNAFAFVADTSGPFGLPPTVGTWGAGTIVDPSFAYITGPALTPGDFNMTVDFAIQPIGSTQFEYYGYVDGTVVKEGIVMFLADGSWQGSWRYADLGGAPQIPGSSVPEPGTMMLLGMGVVGLYGFNRKNKTI